MQFTVATFNGNEGQEVTEEKENAMLISEGHDEWENREKTYTFKFTDSASREFMDGFICQMLGNYYNDFLPEGIYPDMFEDVISRCWHFDTPTDELLESVQDSYFIDAKGFEDYGVVLSTNNPEEFVSGMKTCSTILNGENLSLDFPDWKDWLVYTRAEFPNHEDQDIGLPISDLAAHRNLKNVSYC